MGAGEVEVEVGEVLMFVNFMGDERRRGGGCVFVDRKFREFREDSLWHVLCSVLNNVMISSKSRLGVG